MAKRIWKFVGGSKSARTSLNAALAATVENHEGEVAIYNSETGELYDRAGTAYPPVVRHQYDTTCSILAMIIVHAMTGEEIPAKTMAGLITQIGGEMLEDVRGRARTVIQAIQQTESSKSGESDDEGQGGS